jgi:DNA sulfur modification protein DndD
LYTDKVYKQLKKDFELKEDNDKTLQEKKIRLSSEIDKLKTDYQVEEEQFTNYCNERDTAKEVFENKNVELNKFEECAKILADINFLTTQKLSKIELRSALIDSQKSEIFEKWMYAGTENILKQFLLIYDKSKIEKRIPEPIRQDFIKEMLEKERCLVCDSDAKQNSSQYKKIFTYLNEKSLDKETELINKLSQVADSTLTKVTNIKSEIKDFYKKITNVDEQIKVFNARMKSKEEELKEVIPTDVSADEIRKRNFAQLQIDRDNAKNDFDKFESKISGAKSKKDYINANILEKQKEYDALVASSSNTKEKERLQISEKINDTTSTFYERFLSKLIVDIETESNQYFEKMTEKNIALSGKVKVDYDIKEVYTIDESGNRLFNINQANKVSLQISFVAAVLSVSNKFWNTYFPFIADAPISALGGNNKLTTIETMINIFNQSIIILKDDAVTDDTHSLRNDLTRRLIEKNKLIENAYELKMMGSKAGEQYTKIEKIK